MSDTAGYEPDSVVRTEPSPSVAHIPGADAFLSSVRYCVPGSEPITIVPNRKRGRPRSAHTLDLDTRLHNFMNCAGAHNWTINDLSGTMQQIYPGEYPVKVIKACLNRLTYGDGNIHNPSNPKVMQVTRTLWRSVDVPEPTEDDVLISDEPKRVVHRMQTPRPVGEAVSPVIVPEGYVPSPVSPLDCSATYGEVVEDSTSASAVWG